MKLYFRFRILTLKLSYMSKLSHDTSKYMGVWTAQQQDLNSFLFDNSVLTTLLSLYTRFPSLVNVILVISAYVSSTNFLSAAVRRFSVYVRKLRSRFPSTDSFSTSQCLLSVFLGMHLVFQTVLLGDLGKS